MSAQLGVPRVHVQNIGPIIQFIHDLVENITLAQWGQGRGRQSTFEHDFHGTYSIYDTNR